MQRKFLINMSNIHSGGALQVANSFVAELLKLESRPFSYKILISNEIASSFEKDELIKSDWSFEVHNTYGLQALWSSLNKIQNEFDSVFTLFGPKYTFFRAKKDIVGFAQANILELNNPALKKLPYIQRKKLQIKYILQTLFFKRSDYLIVELDHVRESLESAGIFPKKSISVVNNTVSSLYFNESSWHPLKIDKKKDEIAVGFITRDYPHKNIQILAKVAKILDKNYSMHVKFYFSLNEDEWKNYEHEFDEYGETVGSLSVFECPNFYREMDAVIFPSLVESFSASPIEALIMKKPLFASNKDFVKDVCKEHAYYFDPTDENSIADTIYKYFNGKQKTLDELNAAHEYVKKFSSARDRALKYLQIIEDSKI